jgi:predicted protein tyrosine phosphatase
VTYLTSSSIDFDLDTVSWVTPQLAVTNIIGAQNAWNENECYIINTAAEIITPCDYKIPIVPHDINIRSTLDVLATLIHNLTLQTDSKIVVHCYAGIERSALTCAYYLSKHHNARLAEAYRIIQKIRPVVMDRSRWIEA